MEILNRIKRDNEEVDIGHTEPIQVPPEDSILAECRILSSNKNSLTEVELMLNCLPLFCIQSNDILLHSSMHCTVKIDLKLQCDSPIIFLPPNTSPIPLVARYTNHRKAIIAPQ